MIHVLLTQWRHNTIFTCLCISRWQDFFCQKPIKGACFSHRYFSIMAKFEQNYILKQSFNLVHAYKFDSPLQYLS